MWAEIIKILKKLGLIGLVITALSTLGVAINALPVWHWLTDFFSIIKSSVLFIDFMWDTTTTLTIIGTMMTIIVAYWTWRLVMIVVGWFNH